MRQVRRIAVGILVAIAMVPPLAIAAQDNYEIDLKELGPAKTKAKPQAQPQASPPATGEIDLKELRSIAPPQPVKPAQRKRHSQAAATPEAAATTATAEPGQESIHVVQPGDNLFKILMKQYGLSNPAAERLIPEVIRLNGITSSKGLKAGQRLRIPLPAKNGKQSASLPASKSKQEPRRPAPVVAQAAVPVAPTTKPDEHPSPADTISIISTLPCMLARDMVEKMGLLTASPSSVEAVETVSAIYAGRSVTVACGLSRADQYTYERLLNRRGKQLLTFAADESAEHVVEKLANRLGLQFHKRDADAAARPLTYIFAPFDAWTREVQLTILPVQVTPPPPATGTPEK